MFTHVGTPADAQERWVDALTSSKRVKVLEYCAPANYIFDPACEAKSKCWVASLQDFMSFLQDASMPVYLQFPPWVLCCRKPADFIVVAPTVSLAEYVRFLCRFVCAVVASPCGV